jgi:hypothetical protein
VVLGRDVQCPAHPLGELLGRRHAWHGFGSLAI